MRSSSLARCPGEGLPLVMVVSTPRCFMEAIRAAQDPAWGVVVVRCPLCDHPDESVRVG